MKLHKFGMIALLGSTMLVAPSYAQLQINPFPLGENQDAPAAKAAPKTLLPQDMEPLPVIKDETPEAEVVVEELPAAAPVAVIKTEDLQGEPAEIVLPTPAVPKVLSKIERERALLGSLNVPKPGSDYFDENGSALVEAAEADVVEVEPVVEEPEAEPLVARMSDDYSDLEPLDMQDTMDLDDGEALPMPGEAVIATPVMDEPATLVSEPEEEATPVKAAPAPLRYDPSKLVVLDLENKKIGRLDGALIGSAPVEVQEAAPVAEPLVASTKTASVEPMDAPQMIDGQAMSPKFERAVSTVKAMPVKSWEANEGDSVRTVLQDWAARENVELVWDSMNEFSVLEGFQADLPFASAVKALLDQYQDGQVRPVAMLHVDPDTQSRILVVQVEGL